MSAKFKPGEGVERFFFPKGIAIIGASSTPGKIGYVVTSNLKRMYKGYIYPVNPRAKEILGLPVYPNILEVPDPVDLAIVSVPAPVVPRVIEEIGKRGVKAAIIFSAGFREVGKHGAELEKKVLKIARTYGVRIIGPNCIGVYSPPSNLNATFLDPDRQGLPESGHIAFISQSGALGAALLDWAEANGIGISRFVSVGNKVDVDESDLLAFLRKDKWTWSIALYIEGVSDGASFRRELEETTPLKPVVVLKAGRTTAGARAAASHTGSLAGSYAVYDAVFKQTGVIQAVGPDELFEYVTALAFQPPMLGRRVGIITVGGGSGVMATDALLELGLEVPELSINIQSRLRRILLPIASTRNPVDITGSGSVEQLAESLRIVAESGEVDGIILIPYFNIPTITEDAPKILADTIREIHVEYPVPIVVSVTGGRRAWKLALELRDLAGITIYPSEARAARAIYALYLYGKWLKKRGVVEERVKEYQRRILSWRTTTK